MLSVSASGSDSVEISAVSPADEIPHSQAVKEDMRLKQ
jgi:hypothetical protein